MNTDERTINAMVETLRAAGYRVIPPDQVKQASECPWCDEGRDGDCVCPYPCGAAYCHWDDYQPEPKP